MTNKIEYWYCSGSGLSYRLPCRYSKIRLARYIRLNALALRVEADRLTETPDLPGSGAGGAPSNGEIAGGLMETVRHYANIARKVETGEIVFDWETTAPTDDELLHKQAVEVLAHEVSIWTLQNIDCYPRVRLWLRFAGRAYGIDQSDAFAMLKDRPCWQHPYVEYVEAYLGEES